jgi:hypothetical protein
VETALLFQGFTGRIVRAGLLAIWILGTSCAPSRPVITVEPARSSLSVNETASVFITVEHITGVTAFEVHLTFDANTLEVIELKGGGFVRADFVVQNTFDNAIGTVDYAVAQIDHTPASGRGTLFEIVFRAKAEGKARIQFRPTQAAKSGALFSDSNGMAIQVSLRNGSINVHDS